MWLCVLDGEVTKMEEGELGHDKVNLDTKYVQKNINNVREEREREREREREILLYTLLNI